MMLSFQTKHMLLSRYDTFSLFSFVMNPGMLDSIQQTVFECRSNLNIRFFLFSDVHLFSVNYNVTNNVMQL